jgi:hypothetical protein
MKFFFIQAILFAILIGLQHSVQWHWLWVTTYVLADPWIWFLIAGFGLVIVFINHPRVERRILVNTKKMTATKRFLYFAKDWCFAMIWLVLLDSPYMALWSDTRMRHGPFHQHNPHRAPQWNLKTSHSPSSIWPNRSP